MLTTAALRWLLCICACSGLLAVALGAWGAHAPLDNPAKIIFANANQYHFYHTLALLFCVSQMRQTSSQRAWWISSVLFLLGLFLFSGSLYLKAIGIINSAPLAPIGGTTWLLAWAALAYASFQD